MANLSLFRGDTWTLNFALQDIDPTNSSVTTPHPIVTGALYQANFPGIPPAASVVLSTLNENEINVTDAVNGKFTAIVSPAKTVLVNKGTSQAVDIIETLYVTPTGNLNGTTTVAGLSSVAGILPGATVTGTDIAANTTVFAILSSSSLQLSTAALGTASGVTLTISSTETTFEKVKILNVLDRANP